MHQEEEAEWGEPLRSRMRQYAHELLERPPLAQRGEVGPQRLLPSELPRRDRLRYERVQDLLCMLRDDNRFSQEDVALRFADMFRAPTASYETGFDSVYFKIRRK